MPPTWTSGEASSDSESVDSKDLCPLGQGFFCCKKGRARNGPAFLLGWKKTKLFIRRYAHLCRRCEPAAEQPPGFPLGREIPIRAEIGRESPEPPAARNRDSCAVCGATASGFPPERKAGFPAQPICQSYGSGHCPPHSRNPKVFLTIPARIGTPFQPFKGNREPEMARRCSEHSSRLSPGAVDHICVKPAGTRGHLLHHNIARNKTRRRVLSVLPCHDI